MDAMEENTSGMLVRKRGVIGRGAIITVKAVYGHIGGCSTASDQ